MRLWSIHPKYLDTKGLLAAWRESLLAKKVLENLTKGYKNHPQLIRFKNSSFPLESINFFLQVIWQEANNRNYKFDSSKFIRVKNVEKITVTKGQIDFERSHLLRKLAIRDPGLFGKVEKISDLDIHPLFTLIPGGIEEWEKT
jgi:hypothetical protein